MALRCSPTLGEERSFGSDSSRRASVVTRSGRSPLHLLANIFCSGDPTSAVLRWEVPPQAGPPEGVSVGAGGPPPRNE
ncbi:MAG: hypothetical protein ACREC5_01185 [Thermoplasmata archaeon]